MLNDRDLSRLAEGSLLPGESILDSDFQKWNCKIWKVIESIPKKVWNSINKMGVEGKEEDEVFEGIIRGFEDMERKNGAGLMECYTMVPLLVTLLTFKGVAILQRGEEFSK